ncbi:acyltransferase [Luteimonas aestuarii]|uniref:Acyltransferase n=1 Tax=Luteimonas aestuarii TaxID=453837 RepID=A0A4R5U0P6_9GAMM|nr:acyltransferase [Luteimonas aestuarii]TDK27111.1 acyltransferase [Luteimonas aestuarii]
MSSEWKQRREGGSPLAMRLLRALSCRLGRGPARLLLYPIVLYFLLRRGAERQDSRAYLNRVLGRPATLRDVARHIHTFASTILDRVFLLREDIRGFDVRTEGLGTLNRHLDAGRGVLLFGSHLGSFEALRVLSRQRPECKIRVLLDRSHSRAVTEMLDALNPEIAASVIDAGQDGPSIALAIGEALSQGAMVALLVDRSHAGSAVEYVPFLGEPAAFPTAPWLLAAVLKVPVMLTFGLYRGGNRYDLVFEPFSEGIELPRGKRREGVVALIRRYAARLEHHARSAPYNWFNFYDFWKRDDAVATTGHGLPAADAAGHAGIDGVRRTAG